MKIKINKQNVGNRIKKIRVIRNYTLEEFGKLFGANKSNVFRWENGSALPNKERMLQLTKLAGITVNELLYGDVQEFVRENYNENRGTEDGKIISFDYLKADAFIIHCKEYDIDLDINNIEHIISEFEKFNIEFQKGVDIAKNNNIFIEEKNYSAYISKNLYLLNKLDYFFFDIMYKNEYNFKEDEEKMIRDFWSDIPKVLEILIDTGVDGAYKLPSTSDNTVTISKDNETKN